ncbi:DUF1878 domain-containing protein [Alkalihalophilus marmarensis]|uniref:DUF1878 domain-containing protein n=1 Tax=Alkalihalophilus marmarensis TaxID=521377 RepID=UPI002E1D02B2|nr:DUF1878 domain-containing protein [Alkalihalophilus marmarensis]
MDYTLEERLDLIEFRQRLLFDNDDFSRLMFDHDVTRKQLAGILDLFSSLRNRIDDGEEVSSSRYELNIYELVPQHEHNYHFAESVAQTLHEAGRFEEVFEELYGDTPKFKSYLESHNK